MQTQDKATASEVLKEFDREGIQKILNQLQEYDARDVFELLHEIEAEDPDEDGVDWIRAFATLGALHHLKAIEANAE